MTKSVAQKLLLIDPGHSLRFDGLGKSTLSIVVDGAENPRGYAANYGIGIYCAGNDCSSCDDDVVANCCARKENGIHANEDVIADHNWRNDIDVRPFLSKDPDSAIMGNETYAECQFYMVADRNEIWFCPECAAINSAKFAIIANNHAYAACISNRILFDLPVVPGPCRYPVRTIRHQYADPSDPLGSHRFMMAPKYVSGNSLGDGAVNE